MLPARDAWLKRSLVGDGEVKVKAAYIFLRSGVENAWSPSSDRPTLHSVDPNGRHVEGAGVEKKSRISGSTEDSWKERLSVMDEKGTESTNLDGLELGVLSTMRESLERGALLIRLGDISQGPYSQFITPRIDVSLDDTLLFPVRLRLFIQLGHRRDPA